MSGRTPTVKLLSFPTNIHGMLYYAWKRSRNDAELEALERCEQAFWFYAANKDDPNANLYSDAVTKYYNLGKDVYETVQKMIDEDIPIIEHAWFVFEMEDVPVMWREQAVRQRIGVRFGDDYLWDIIFGADQQSFWSQTSRIIPDHNFVDEGRYFIPDTIKHHPNPEVKLRFENNLIATQSDIRFMHEAGIPVEDSRALSTSCKTHSISWVINAKALKHVFGRRSCFLMQAGIWKPVLEGMAKCIREVSPLLAQVVHPPCMSKGKFRECPIKHTNEELIRGNDLQPVCPLYLTNYRLEASRVAIIATRMAEVYSDSIPLAWEPIYVENYDELLAADMLEPRYVGMPIERSQGLEDGAIVWCTNDPVRRQKMVENRAAFQELWGLNVDTGEPLESK